MNAGRTSGERKPMASRAGDGVTCECPTDAYGVRTHPSDCPTVAWIKDEQRRLQPSLIEMDRVRRRGAAKARNYVIG